jgi:hypothetical protein
LGPGVQQIIGFFPYAPVAYSVLTATVLLVVISWTVVRFVRRPSQERAALYIEQKQPKLRNNLINSLQLYPQIAEAKDAPGFSTSMVLALLRSTRRQITTLQLDELVDTGPIKARLRLLAVLFVPALAMVLFNPSWVGETFSLLTVPERAALDGDHRCHEGLRVGRPPVTCGPPQGNLNVELIVWAEPASKAILKAKKNRHGKPQRRKVLAA